MSPELAGQLAKSTFESWGLIGLAVVLFGVGTVTAGMWGFSLWSFRTSVREVIGLQRSSAQQLGVIVTQTQSLLNAISDQQRQSLEIKDRMGQLCTVFDRMVEQQHQMDLDRAKELMQVILHLQDIVRGSYGGKRAGDS